MNLNIQFFLILNVFLYSRSMTYEMRLKLNLTEDRVLSYLGNDFLMHHYFRLYMLLLTALNYLSNVLFPNIVNLILKVSSCF